MSDLAARIDRAKREVLRDIASGTVPATVAGFAELHDYVDANGYGGAFEDGAPVPASQLWDDLQDAIDAWLAGGRPFSERNGL